ncbi:MAG: transposase, partial [Bacteroidales bacterium]|nr:transposase [Bacteroidales bacterium]
MMENIFKDITILEFENLFSTDEKCLEFLADGKWKEGFVCRKCGHTNFCKGKKPFSRRCTKCKTEESATAHTVFHKCKIPLAEAFKITFLVCHNPEISTQQISERIHIRQMTCWKFKKKITDCIDQRGDINLLEKAELKKSILG